MVSASWKLMKDTAQSQAAVTVWTLFSDFLGFLHCCREVTYCWFSLRKSELTLLTLYCNKELCGSVSECPVSPSSPSNIASIQSILKVSNRTWVQVKWIQSCSMKFMNSSQPSVPYSGLQIKKIKKIWLTLFQTRIFSANCGDPLLEVLHLLGS